MIGYVLGAAVALALPEVHVVAIYEGHGGAATVTVDRPGCDVVLIVSAYHTIEWDVRATPQTRLNKVIFGGRERQTWKFMPGVETEEMSVACVKQRVRPLSLYADYRVDSLRTRLFLQDMQQYTGWAAVASFRGTYRPDPKKPFVVDAVQDDERLSADFPRVAPAVQIPKFKFEATRIVYGDRPFGERRGYGEFTQAGPTEGGFAPMPKRINWIAHDAKGKQHYGLDGHDFYTVDMKRGTSAKIPKPDDEFSWPRALTHDAKRARVLITTRGGMFEYSTKAGGAWTQLDIGRVSYAALAWQSKTDTLFAFDCARVKGDSEKLVPTLYELNADGTVAKSTPLGSPLFPAMLGDRGAGGQAELIDLGAELALLVHCENRDTGDGRRGRPEAFLYVIDPKTGKSRLAWKE